MLTMHSVSHADLTARARIREAAIRRFAMDGLDAPLRSIAADAGVSPALILHHFGSRAGLRQACDDHVHQQIRQTKSEVLAGPAPPASLLAQMVNVEEYVPQVAYVLRCLQAGGPLARRFVEDTVADAVGYLEAGVSAGTLRPSRNPQARARYLTEASLGSLLLQHVARDGPLDLDELPKWFRDYAERIILPALEVCTEPLLTNSTLLDAYLEAHSDVDEGPPDGPPRTHSRST
jgi:AcrR family transcriptional regulator